MSNLNDEPAFPDPFIPARCRVCHRKGEDCKCSTPEQVRQTLQTPDYEILWDDGQWHWQTNQFMSEPFNTRLDAELSAEAALAVVPF